MVAPWHWITERSIGKAIAVLVLLLGLLVSALAWRAENARAREEAQARSLEYVNALAARIKQRLVAYEVVLRAGESLFAVTGTTPTRAQWTAFVDAFDLEHSYPGLQGVAYAPRLQPQEVSALEQRVRDEGLRTFRIWPSGPRAESAPILHIEPMNAANVRALGFDMLSEPERRQAMNASRDSGHAAMTRGVALVQDTGGPRRIGMIVYVPVYNGPVDESPGAVQQRRSAHRGWVYAPFRPAELMAGLQRGDRPPVLVRLYDSAAPEAGALLYRDAGLPDSGPLPAGSVRVSIDAADRTWTLEGTPSPVAAAGVAFSSRSPWALLAGGLLVSLLLSGVLWSMATTRDRAYTLARSMTAALRRANEELDFRVRQRTEALSASNAQLRDEIAERQRVEAERSAALERERERTGQLRALADAGLGVGSLPDEQARLEYLADRALRIAGCRHAFLVRMGVPEERRASVASELPMSFENRRALLEASRHWPQRERIEVVRASANEPLVGSRAWPAGCSEAMIVPVRVGERNTATLYLLHADDRRFRPEDEAVIHQLALLVASAMETADAVERERHARMEAESANASKDEFLAIVSHELRTPLHAILGWLQVLDRKAGSPAHVRRAIEVIRRNAEAQSTLIDDLLDLARIEQGKLALEMQRVHFDVMVRDVAESQRLAANANGLALDVRIERRGDVYGDPVRLQQAVGNLVVNAVKFSSPGGRVALRLHGDDERLVLEIEDEGEGIDPEVLPQLFQRFRQGDPSSPRGKVGLGLGLALVKHIVEAHGGAVCASSGGKGFGSVFTLSLPAMPPGEEAEAPRPRPSRHVPHDAPKSETVLVVDGDADAREAVARWLGHESFDVVAFERADGALAWLETCTTAQWPAAVLCDIGMPDRDGYRFYDALRTLEAERGREAPVPVAALGAQAAGNERAQALSYGFAAHLAKPLSTEHLARALGRMLRASPPAAETAENAAPASASPVRTDERPYRS